MKRGYKTGGLGIVAAFSLSLLVLSFQNCSRVQFDEATGLPLGVERSVQNMLDGHDMIDQGSVLDVSYNDGIYTPEEGQYFAEDGSVIDDETGQIVVPSCALLKAQEEAMAETMTETTGGGGNVAVIYQSGDGNMSEIEQTGQNNIACIIQVGDNNRGRIVQYGDDNSHLIDQQGSGNTQEIIIE